MRTKNYFLGIIILFIFHLNILAQGGQGSGADGAVTVAANSNFYSLANTAKTALTANAASGQKVITVASNTNFPNGTLVLVIQMLGTNLGLYEEATVSSSTATSLTFTANLTNSYYGTGANKAQAIRVMQYTNLTINAGITLTVDGWDGSTGGIMYIEANGTVAMTATSIITATGSGFRGGAAGAGGAGGTGGAGGATAGAAGSPGSGGGAGGNAAGGAAGTGGGCTVGTAGGAGGLNGAKGSGTAAVGGEGNGLTPGPLICGTGGQGGTGGCGGSGGGGGGAGGEDGTSSHNTIWTAGTAGGNGVAGGAGGTSGDGGGCIWINCNTINAVAGAVISANGSAGAVGAAGGVGGIAGVGGKGSGATNPGTGGGGGGGGDAGDNGDSGGGGGGGGGGQIKITAGTTTAAGTRTATKGTSATGTGGTGSAKTGGSAGAGGTGGCVAGAGGTGGTVASMAGGGGGATCGGTAGTGSVGSAGVAGTAGAGSAGRGGTSGSCGNGGGGSVGACAATNGTTNGTASGLGGAGGFSACTTTALPIELLSFYAQPKNKSVYLTWVTASEINNHYFTLEKTIDGRDYREVRRVKGAGNSVHLLNYSYTDDNPFSGFSYYRLKQTDYDGNFSYSNIVPVNFTANNDLNIDIYPNPVIKNMELKYYAKSTNNLFVKIMDIERKIVYTHSNNTELGENSFILNTEDLAKGLYFMEITNGEETIFKKFMKE